MSKTIFASSGKKTLILLFAFLFLGIGIARADGLSERLKGRILLQVQSHGEAWYVNPDTQKRFYLGRPNDAFRIMREQGLGVSNKDFDSFAGIAPERLAGKILLKVESKGEAYYVYPVDLKMHYLGRPADAFAIMRNFGLGITDSNLALIAIDEKSSPVITKEPVSTPPVEEIATSTPPIEEIATSTPPVEEIATSTPPIEEIATSTPPVEEIATSSCVWLAEYFLNINLFGEPEATSTVNKIDFNWEGFGPDQIFKTDNFSARFTANCYFEGGNYEFQTKYDDAIRVYLDNENFLQSWTNNNKEQTFNRERNIEQGTHEVKVEYYDAVGRASLSVDWVKIN